MKKILIGLTVTVSLLLCVLTLSIGASPKVYAVKPFAKNAIPGSQIVFVQEDFTANIIGGGVLVGILPLSLPAADQGALMCNKTAIQSDVLIPTSELGDLVFVPTSDNEFSASLSFVPVFKGSASDVGGAILTVTLNYHERINVAPSVSDLNVNTQRDLNIEIVLSAYDADGDALTYNIASQDGHGTILNCEGRLIFEPAPGKTGKTVLSYYAVDARGNTSAFASVTITIEKPKTDIVYSDLSGSTMLYPAIKMAEAGNFIGERIGDTLIFNPNKPATRAEFVAISMAAAKISPQADVALAFAGTPEWQGTYMAAALSLGLIDNPRADDIITGNEAALIVARLLDRGVSARSSPGDTVLTAAGKDAFGLGIIKHEYLLEKELTRSDAVEILYRMTQLESGAVLGWKSLK